MARSLRYAWKSTHCRHGLRPNRTANDGSLQLPLVLHHLLCLHKCCAEEAHAPHHGLDQSRERGVVAVDHLQEDTAEILLGGAHLHRMFHLILRVIYTVVIPRCIAPPKQKPRETTVSGDDLRQMEREDVVTSLQPLLKEGPYRHDCGVA